MEDIPDFVLPITLLIWGTLLSPQMDIMNPKWFQCDICMTNVATKRDIFVSQIKLNRNCAGRYMSFIVGHAGSNWGFAPIMGALPPEICNFFIITFTDGFIRKMHTLICNQECSW